MNRTNHILSQEKLIERCKENNRSAQLELYKKYSDAMYNVAYRFMKDSFEAEEVMQDGFITAFSKLHQFSGKSTFGAWLKKIVIRKSLDRLRVRKTEKVALNEHILKAEEPEDTWETEDHITVGEVKEEIEKLPEKYRYPVMLFLIEGYEHNEISEILNITVISSRTLLFRGKKKLQEQLKEKYYDKGHKGFV